jgi:hypothetical protein
MTVYFVTAGSNPNLPYTTSLYATRTGGHPWAISVEPVAERYGVVIRLSAPAL